tara:strand:- start:1291 stop:1440 length:150 start_codon:yes stop_codon:yes gene_type:complete
MKISQLRQLPANARQPQKKELDAQGNQLLEVVSAGNMGIESKDLYIVAY